MHYFKYLGSKESARQLWENREALDRYLKRLKELIEEDSSPKNKTINMNRKNRLDLNEPSELAIYNAMQEVEKVGADVRLTKVVTLLSEAKDVLGDYFDEKLGESMKTLGANR